MKRGIKIIVLLVILSLVFTTVVSANMIFKVSGESMLPALKEGDFIQIISDEWEEGDVVAALAGNQLIVKKVKGNRLVSIGVGESFNLDDVEVLGKVGKTDELIAAQEKWRKINATTSWSGSSSGTFEPSLGGIFRITADGGKGGNSEGWSTLCGGYAQLPMAGGNGGRVVADVFLASGRTYDIQVVAGGVGGAGEPTQDGSAVMNGGAGGASISLIESGSIIIRAQGGGGAGASGVGGTGSSNGAGGSGSQANGAAGNNGSGGGGGGAKTALLPDGYTNDFGNPGQAGTSVITSSLIPYKIKNTSMISGANVEAQKLSIVRLSVLQAKAANYTLIELWESGYTPAELIEGGYAISELISIGVPPSMLSAYMDIGEVFMLGDSQTNIIYMPQGTNVSALGYIPVAGHPGIYMRDVGGKVLFYEVIFYDPPATVDNLRLQ